MSHAKDAEVAADNFWFVEPGRWLRRGDSLRSLTEFLEIKNRVTDVAGGEGGAVGERFGGRKILS